MKKVVFTFLVLIGLAVLFLQYGYQPLIGYLGLKPRAGLWVESTGPAQILLNGKDLGQTPLKNTDLTEGQYQLELKDSSSSADWKENIQLNGGTLTVVNRELDPDPTQSSGEVITLEKGSGVRVTSMPGGAEVLVDGVDKGATPLFVNNLSAGEHQFILSKDNYLKRSIKAVVTDGYSLNLVVDLAQDNSIATAPSPTPPPVNVPAKLKVLQTPTGFLRVRDSASTDGNVVTQVAPGDELTLEEETNSDWDKVKTTDGKEGYVSTDYVQKE